jgi:hypothetical protein
VNQPVNRSQQFARFLVAPQARQPSTTL